MPGAGFRRNKGCQRGAMHTLVDTIEALGSVATRKQLEQRGYTGWHLTAGVRAGVIRRIRRGWYSVPSATFEQLVAVRVGGRLSHSSAAKAYGLWHGSDHRVHVTVTRHAARLRTRGAGSAQRPDLFDQEVDIHWIAPGRVDKTSPRTWIVSLDDCLRGVVAACDRETAVACLDSAISVGAVTPRGIQRIFRLEGGAAQNVAAGAKPGSDSGAESIARQRFERSGFRVEQQVHVPTVGRVDMLLNGVVYVEVDGFAYHSDPVAFENDRRRDALLTALGLTHLRFSYKQVTEDWPFVEQIVADTLSQFRSVRRKSGARRVSGPKPPRSPEL
jgi:very-short-patch-repair endonuclease